MRCAGAIEAAARPLGLRARAGLHTGELELQGDDVAGMAVHIGARVCALAGPDEVLVAELADSLAALAGERLN